VVIKANDAVSEKRFDKTVRARPLAPTMTSLPAVIKLFSPCFYWTAAYAIKTSLMNGATVPLTAVYGL